MIITQAEILYQDPIVVDRLYRTAAPTWIQEFDYKEYNRVPLAEAPKVLCVENQINIEKGINFHRFIHRILSDSEVQQDSTLTISWNPSYQTLKFHFIRVYRDGKILDKLDKAKIRIIQQEQNADRHLYDGTSSALIFLDGIQESDVIDYAYSIEGFNTVFAPHFCHTAYLEFNEPVERHLLRILAPKNYHLFVHKQHTQLEPKITLLNETQQEWLWETFHLDEHHSETNQPSWYQDFSQVQISSFETWQDVVNWNLAFYQLPQNLATESPIEMIELVQAWKQAYATPEEQALQALRFVQDKIRYLGFEQGDHSFKPHSPQEVFERRFGDCKDKVQLLRAFLALMGIDSYPVLVNPSLTQSLKDYHPSPTIFNHAMLLIRIQGQEYWIDPTMSYQGGNLSKNYCRSMKYGLVLEEGAHDLTEIPPSNLAETTLNMTFLINEEEGAFLKVLTVYKEGDADTFRSYYKRTQAKKVAKDFETYYSGIFGTLKVIEPIQIEDNRLENRITVQESYYIEKLLKTDETSQMKGFLIFPIHLRSYLNVIVDPNRQTPLQHEFPLNIKETYVLIKPKGEQWKAQHEEYTFADQAFVYTTKVDTQQENMTFAFAYKSLDDHVKPEEMAIHRTLLAQALDHSFYQIQLNKLSSSEELINQIAKWKSWLFWYWPDDQKFSSLFFFLILLIRTLFRIVP